MYCDLNNLLMLVRVTGSHSSARSSATIDSQLHPNVQEDCDDKQDHILHLPPWVPAFLVERPFYRVGKLVYFR